MKTLLLLSIVLVLSLGAGCREEPEVVTYRVAHPEDPAPAAAQPERAEMGELPPDHPPIGDGDPMSSPPPPGMETAPAHVPWVWEIPERWIIKQPSAMRLASCDVPPIEEASAAADFSITRLSGAAGGLAGNVNRWRQQIGLAPLAEAQIVATTERVSTGIGEALIVDMHNDAQGESILAGIVEVSDGVLFFKLRGPTATVRSVDAEFRGVVASLADDGHNH